MRKAAKRDENEREVVQALVKAGAKVYRISARGIPDLLVGWRGRWTLLEVKGPKGSLTRAQKEFFEQTDGYPRFAVKTAEEALEALRGGIDGQAREGARRARGGAARRSLGYPPPGGLE